MRYFRYQSPFVSEEEKNTYWLMSEAQILQSYFDDWKMANGIQICDNNEELQKRCVADWVMKRNATECGITIASS